MDPVMCSVDFKFTYKRQGCDGNVCQEIMIHKAKKLKMSSEKIAGWVDELLEVTGKAAGVGDRVTLKQDFRSNASGLNGPNQVYGNITPFGLKMPLGIEEG